MRRRVTRLIAFFLILALFGLCAIVNWARVPLFDAFTSRSMCVQCDRSKVEPDTDNPPIYPGAQDVRRINTPRANTAPPISAHSFKTTAKPDEVFDFYRSKLLKQGWQEEIIPASEYEFQIYFKWLNCNRYTWLYIFVTATDSGKNEIMVEHPPLGILCID